MLEIIEQELLTNGVDVNYLLRADTLDMMSNYEIDLYMDVLDVKEKYYGTIQRHSH